MKILATVLMLLSASLLYSQNSYPKKLSSIISNNIYITFDYNFLNAKTDFGNSKTENGFMGSLEYLKRNRSAIGYGLKAYIGRQSFSGFDQGLRYTAFTGNSSKLGLGAILSFTTNGITPFISTGISYNLYDIELKNRYTLLEVKNKIAFSFDNEIGVKVPVYKGILFNAKAGISFIPSDDLENIVDNAANDYILNGTIGFSFPISKRKDSDGDGIVDSKDPCKYQAEDFDGFEDDDGCPDLDNDFDGVADNLDNCPDQIEDLDGFEDDDGCPDYDNDGDGIFDTNDLCANNEEDFDGFEDSDGCPDLDNDQDGIADIDDLCPYEAEDLDGFQDDDGCPDLDNDFDGIADVNDNCPDLAETINGFEDNDGCPDTKPIEKTYVAENSSNISNTLANENVNTLTGAPKREVIKANDENEDMHPDIQKGDIVLLSEFIFEKDQAKINTEALWQLNKVVKLMKGYPNAKWRIEGFDNSPKTGKNINLTAERTRALSRFLSSRGLQDAEFQLIDKSKSVSTSSSRVTDKKIVIKKVN